ncbi:uncharacterized protein EI97DRAFT_173558 [Westerdykella ornata]|uniref:Uncharacterized protein n=1 Tax=Westerdykella ornata TaxID=318751 RepID=A0A6A6JTB0_WESOR|nr:uncharacterized protein EI97DRAFT_173558 [Westerdykella ornata]KAF2279353.1 hypothetical protein EI97DRAFT_173558 [Westerdykella ornata]
MSARGRRGRVVGKCSCAAIREPRPCVTQVLVLLLESNTWCVFEMGCQPQVWGALSCPSGQTAFQRSRRWLMPWAILLSERYDFISTGRFLMPGVPAPNHLYTRGHRLNRFIVLVISPYHQRPALLRVAEHCSIARHGSRLESVDSHSLFGLCWMVRPSDSMLLSHASSTARLSK